MASHNSQWRRQIPPRWRLNTAVKIKNRLEISSRFFIVTA
ncbi:hypothetical protein L21SP2_2914 [Salinispira pacifica]|uniref:Uncharacterized protein n=1 Tax=Salinispira pacifica TaxID=1307761 RepID=V5WKT8_9SPIO|nr:hypothetical protein L21SP2_2914 [Salinispira pacifica]